MATSSVVSIAYIWLGLFASKSPILVVWLELTDVRAGMLSAMTQGYVIRQTRNATRETTDQVPFS